MIRLVTPIEPTPYQLRPLFQAQSQGQAILHHVEDDRPQLEDTTILSFSPGCRRITPWLKEALNAPTLQRVIIGCHCPTDAKPLLERLHLRGIAILGPASGGIIEPGLCHTWASGVTPDQPMDGRVTLISQGGALGFSLYTLSRGAGAHFRRVVSLGSGHDESSALLALKQASLDPETDLVLFCLEALKDGRTFLNAINDLLQKGKRFILYRVGSEDKLRTNRHPGAQITDDLTWEQVARQWGFTLVRDLRSLVALANLGTLAAQKANPPAIIANSTGLGLTMADALRRKNVPLAPFSPDLLRQLAPLMPPHTVPANPLCMTSHILRTPETLIKTLQALASHPVTPCVVLGPLDSADLEHITPSLIQASKGPNKPLFCLLADWTEQSTHFEQLSASGVILFRSPSDLAEALCLAGTLNTPSPHPNPPLGKSHHYLTNTPPHTDEGHAFELLKIYGIPTAPTVHCLTLAEAHSAAQNLGYPVALKVVSPSFKEKAQARALALDLPGPEELRNAFGRVQERALRSHPDALLRGVLVQKMEEGLEMMVGVKNDPLFGPMVAVALGGALYAVSRDIVLRTAPVDTQTAKDMILSLKGAPLLTGQWNGKPLAVNALADLLAKVSTLPFDEPTLATLDLNPVFLDSNHARVVDAFVRKIHDH